MRRVLQTTFALAFGCALVLAVVFQLRAADVSFEMPNPASDPKYETVANKMPLEISIEQSAGGGPDQALVEEFWAAEQAYERAKASAEYDRSRWSDNRNVAIFLAGLPLALFLFVSLPWETWLRQGADNVGRSADVVIKAARSRIDAHNEGTQIVRRDGLAHYSVADEMLKWKQLRDDGIVSDAEFEEAKAKLLGRKAEA